MQQYSGGAGGPPRLFAFSLQGKATMPPLQPPPGAMPEPPAPRSVAALALKGKAVWDATGCELCHGFKVIGGPGSVPDLRRIGAARLGLFPQIIRGGLLTPLGMPDYRELVSEDDLPALRAYVLEQAWLEYDSQKRYKNAD
jgi:quinohemoprotein ethanol dehydrogenase